MCSTPAHWTPCQQTELRWPRAPRCNSSSRHFVVSEGGLETMPYALLAPTRRGNHPISERESIAIRSARWEPQTFGYRLPDWWSLAHLLSCSQHPISGDETCSSGHALCRPSRGQGWPQATRRAGPLTAALPAAPRDKMNHGPPPGGPVCASVLTHHRRVVSK